MKFIIEYIYTPVDSKKMPELMEISAIEAVDKDEAHDTAVDTGDLVLAIYLEQRGQTMNRQTESVEFRISPQPLWTKQRGEVGKLIQDLTDAQDFPETVQVPAPGGIERDGSTLDELILLEGHGGQPYFGEGR